MRDRHERIERKPESFAFDDVAKLETAAVDVAPILREPRVGGRVGERHEAAMSVACQQHAGFFEQFARRRDVIRARLGGRHVGEVCPRLSDAVAPRRLGRFAVGGIDAPAGKHVRAAHESGPLAAPNHEDFRTVRRIAQDDHRRGRIGDVVSRAGHGFAHVAIMGRTRAASTMDTNGLIASLLRDLASVQTSQQSRWGYKRAAAAVLNLEEPIETLLQADGTLRKIPHVGPSSTRVILEVLKTGRSETVERAVAASGLSGDVEKSRDMRGRFLTRAEVIAALRNATLRGPQLSAYRGDLQMHSTWSDGSQTLADIIEGGLARGYEYCAVSDHPS